MRDLFDDFLEELRKREQAARGQDPDAASRDRRGERPPDDESDPDADDDADEPIASDDVRDDDEDDDAIEGEESADRPVPIDRRRRAGAPPRRGPGGPDDGGSSRAARAGRRFGLGVFIVAILAVILLFSVGIDLWTDALWFQSVGFDPVFWTRIVATFGLGVAAFLVAAVVLLGNLWLAGRLTPPPVEGGPSLRSLVDRINDAAQAADERRSSSRSPFGGGGGNRYGNDNAQAITFDIGELPDLTPLTGWVLSAFALLLALLIGGSVSGAWETVLLWIHRVPFSPTSVVTDPVFGKDISYFLFELPFLRLVQGLFNGIVIAALVLSLTRYIVGASRGGLVFSTPIRVHLAVLGGLFLLSVAFGYQLDKLELVYSNRGVATGVSFTDQNAQFLAFDALTIISGMAAAFLVGGAFTRMIWPLGLTIAVWFVASLVIGRIYPEAVQRFTVEPNKYAQEQQYIGNNIAMTRLAFDIGDWGNVPFSGNTVLTADQITKEADTFVSARLWDPRPLRTTLDQLQTVRKYYDFTDVDTDRYVINDVKRQVMLSARELALEQNPNAAGWVNQRIRFTHGVGAAMVPVNEVGSEGQPQLLVSNLPPASTSGAPTIDPAHSGIYFGERGSSYVVVGAQQNEFDYPTGESDAEGSIGTETRWTGTTGIKLDNTAMRLLFATRFRDLDLLISDQVTSSSQLLFHRSLDDRLRLVAPFLRYDKDPYLVIDAAGRMTYIQDAYTASDRFPNAQSFQPNPLTSGLGGESFDYIRNSVKITVDAYDGTMHFYVNDPDDPLIRAYQGVFPTLFEPMSSMPADLHAHLRIPEDLFNAQTNMFGRYHVTNTQQFFGADDLWTVPVQTSEQTLPAEAYYVEMRLPNEKGVEFLLLQPMVPTGRPNMIAWVAGRMDDPNYGQVQVYRFPADTTIFGPAQIEARIDQDPVISAQVSLWNQSGSKVIRGGLIVVPLDDSLIYLQPVYLQSTGSAFPEFKRIVVASPRQVVWAESLGSALRLLLAAEAAGGPAPSPSPEPHARSGRVTRAECDARTDARAGRQPDGVPAGRSAVGHPRADRLRQPPLRAGPAGAPRLHEVRHGDGARQGCPSAIGGPRSGPGRAEPGSIDQPGAVNRPRVLIEALRISLAVPATWPLALGAFLLRGGIVLVLLPIVVVPTPVGLANVFAPSLSAIAFGSISPELVIASVVSVVAVAAWLVLGGWLAAALEAEGARMVALGAGARPQGTRHVAARILLARAIALLPFVIALSLGMVRIVLVTYRELNSPLDMETPIALRVLRATPEVVVAVVLTWMAGEVVGAIAGRRIALAGDGVGAALRAGVRAALRQPLATVVRFWLPTLVLVALLVASAAAAAAGWAAIDRAFDGPAALPVVFLLVGVFVLLWIAGLVLVGIACAWRAAVWTMAEVVREGTFGGSSDRRPGDWRPDRTSATL